MKDAMAACFDLAGVRSEAPHGSQHDDGRRHWRRIGVLHQPVAQINGLSAKAGAAE